jgi:riboflavin synthase
MFTGLIETVGTLTATRPRGNYKILRILSAFDSKDIEIGESIACDGACLTVVAIQPDAVELEASQETITRTILGGYRIGTAINLERALKVGDRLGGHFVSGHIDDTGVVDYLKPVGESLELAVKFDPSFNNLVVDKGSISINGVSLTVNECRDRWCTVNLIPHTARSTNLEKLRTGAGVNIEFDLIGKYVTKTTGNSKQSGLTFEKLIENGW